MDETTKTPTLRDYFNADFSKVPFDDSMRAAIQASSEQSGQSFEDEAKGALACRWLSSRIGLPQDFIAKNFDEVSQQYFSGKRTPQQVYALVASNYEGFDVIVRNEQSQHYANALADANAAQKDREERDSFLRSNWGTQALATAGIMMVEAGIGISRALGMLSEHMPRSSILGVGIGDQSGERKPSWWTTEAQKAQKNVDFVNDYYFRNSSSVKREIVGLVGNAGALVGSGILGGPEGATFMLASSSYNPTYNATLQKMGTSDKEASDDQKLGAGLVALGATALNAFVWGKAVPGVLPESATAAAGRSVSDAAKSALTRWDSAATLAGFGGTTAFATSLMEDAAAGKNVSMDDLEEATKNAFITGLMGKAFDIYGSIQGQRAVNFQQELAGRIEEARQAIADATPNMEVGTQTPLYRVEENMPMSVEHATAISKGKTPEEIQAFADERINPKENPEANKALADALTKKDEKSVMAYNGAVARQEASIPLRSPESIHSETEAAVRAVAGDRTKGFGITVEEQRTNQKTFGDALFDSINQAMTEAEAVHLREGIIKRGQPTVPEQRAAAEKATENIVTAADRRVISTLVAKEFGLARITPKQWRKLLKDAHDSHARIIQTAYEKIHDQATINRISDLFNARMDDLTRKAADSLARNKAVGDELRHRELQKLANRKNRIIARQTQEIKEQKEKTAAVSEEAALQRNLASYVDRTRVMVERLLPAKQSAKLRNEMMLPRSTWKTADGQTQERVGFKTKEEADAWLDDYMKRAVELGEEARRNKFRDWIDNLIGRQKKAEARAAVSGHLKMTPEAKAAWDEYHKEVTREYDPVAERLADEAAERKGLPAIIRRPTIKNKDISSDELEQIYNDLKNIRATGKTEWREQQDAINSERDVADKVSANLVQQQTAREKSGLVRRAVYGGLHFFDRISILGRDGFYDTTRFVQGVGQRNSVPERLWHDGIQRGSFSMANILDEGMQTMRESRQRHGLWGKNFDEYFTGDDGKIVRLNGEKITLSEAMEIYAHSRLKEGPQWDSLVNSEFNRKPLSTVDEQTRQRDTSMIDNLVASIPKEVKAHVDDMIDWLDTRGFELADRQFYAEHGVHLEKRQGYFPLAFLDHYNEFESTYRRSLGYRGFTKKATGGAPIKEFDFAGKLSSHLSALARYSGLHPECDNIRRTLFRSVHGGVSDFQRAMNDWEKGAGDDLRKRLDDIERGSTSTDEEAINKIANLIRKNYATSVIGANISPIIKSHATMCLAMREIPIKYISEGMRQTMLHPVEMYRFLQENTRSRVVRDRNVMIDQTIRGRNMLQRLQNTGQLVGYWPMRMFDRLSTDMAWCSKYSEVLHEGGGTEMAHAEAVRQADDLVERSFASFDFESLSPNQRSNNAMMKILFQFTNDANHAYNAFVRDCAGAKDGIELMKVFGNWAFLMAPIYTGILAAGTMAGTAQKRALHYFGEQVFGWYPQDEENWMEKLEESMILEGQVWPFRSFGFINELQGYWARRFTSMAMPDADVYEGEMFSQPFNLGAFELLQRGQYLGMAGGILGIPGGVQAGSMIDKELNQD